MNPGDSNDPGIIKRVTLGASDGRPPLQYRIQVVNEPLLDEAAAFMVKYFASANLLTSLDYSLVNVKNENKPDDSILSIWKRPLSEGISLAAFLEDHKGNRSCMICCSVLKIVKKEDECDLETTQDTASYYIDKTLADVKRKADLFNFFNCETYVEGDGLATATDYQRRGIAGEVMGVRAEVCRLINIPICAAVFTGEASQNLALRYGYKTLSELDLTSYRIDGKVVYPRPVWPVIKCMAIRFF